MTGHSGNNGAGSERVLRGTALHLVGLGVEAVKRGEVCVWGRGQNGSHVTAQEFDEFAH